MSMESSDGLLEEMGAQALSTGSYQAPETIVQGLDFVTHEDVVNVSTYTNHHHLLTTAFERN